MHISLCFIPVLIDKPAQLEDVSVIYQPDDGEGPALATDFLGKGDLWRWSPEGSLVSNQHSITHWSHKPESLAQFDRRTAHAHTR